VGVQALGPEASVEGFDVCVVSRLAGTREVQRDAVGISPQVQIARDELGALIDPDRRRIADGGTGLLKGRNDVLGAVAEPRIDDRRKPRECVDDRQNTDLLPGRQLVVHEVHGPGFVRLRRLLAVVPQLGLDPPSWRLVAEL
jgi:hypothetical protein